MRRSAIALLAGALTFCYGCGSDPHKLKITEQNKGSFMESIKDSKGLTVEENRLLIAYEIRNVTGRAFGGNETNVVGKTVAQVIQEERQLEEKQKKEQVEQNRLAEEAAAKEQARAAELRKAVNLSVYDKSFQAADPTEGSYQDYIVIRCAYENTSGKNIRAFKGKLHFTDLFGGEIYQSGLTISDPIEAGQKATWAGTIKYNQFLDNDVRLKNAALRDMKAEWLPSSIIFTDGTRIGDE